MDQIRIETEGARPAGFFDMREDAQLPVRDQGSAAMSGAPARARRSWLGIATRIVRDALIAVALMASIPIGIVAFNGDRAWRSNGFSNNTRARISQSEAMRPLALPKDASITPLQAGLAFNALQPKVEAKGFPMIEPAVRLEASWEHAIITPDMFPTAQPNMSHAPSTQAILEAGAKGFTPQEMAYLKTLATAPVWRNFDLIARAPAVDLIGGRFKVPFSPDVRAYELPLIQFKFAREVANAAVSRAAYHMALGQRDSAEIILRSVVSFGFTLVDNGTSIIDELIGNVIVGGGRDGLRRFYVITKDPRATMPALMPLAKVDATPDPMRAGNSEDRRRLLIARSQDPKMTPGERYEALNLLSASACTNVRELLLGRRSDVTDALRNASTQLARYPSERALVELLGREPDFPRPAPYFEPFNSLAVSAATVVGTVLHNPRLAACTRLVGSYFMLP
ncbi:hypothetical protein BH11GEM1_BH11GEM1_20800 [soil metagenome]